MPDKKRFLESETYKDKRDLLNAVLKDGVDYSPEDVDKLIRKYEKKEVR